MKVDLILWRNNFLLFLLMVCLQSCLVNRRLDVSLKGPLTDANSSRRSLMAWCQTSGKPFSWMWLFRNIVNHNLPSHTQNKRSYRASGSSRSDHTLHRELLKKKHKIQSNIAQSALKQFWSLCKNIQHIWFEAWKSIIRTENEALILPAVRFVAEWLNAAPQTIK